MPNDSTLRTLACLMVKFAWQYRADARARHFHADRNIGRTAYDGQRLRFTDIDLAHIQAIRVGMLGHLQHFGDHHVVERGRDGFHRLDFQPGHGQRMRQCSLDSSGLTQVLNQFSENFMCGSS